MNNNTFAHVYRYAEHSEVAAHDFFDKWKSVIISTKSRLAAIVEFTMKNNDVHVFLPDILYHNWCLGRTYYMDGILYRGEYPCNRPIQKEDNMGTLDIEIEIQKAKQDGYETAMDEAREAIIELSNLTTSERYNIFGREFLSNVVLENSMQRIIGKLYEYKEKSKICVGDEYSFNRNTKVVVTNVNKFEDNVYFFEDGGVTDYMNIDEFKKKFKKTGKMYPELTKILKGLKS